MTYRPAASAAAAPVGESSSPTRGRRIGAQPAARLEVDVGRGLGVLDLVAGDGDGEQVGDAGAVRATRSRKSRGELLADRDGHPGRPQRVDEVDGARARGSTSCRASSITSAWSSAISARPSPGRPSIASSLPAATRVRRADQLALVLEREHRAVAAEQLGLGARPRLLGVEQQAVVVEDDRGGDRHAAGYEVRREPSAGSRQRNQTGGPLGQREPVEHLEAVAPVERQVALAAGLQVGGQAVAVAELQAGPDQARAHAGALGGGVDPEHRQVQMALVRMARLDLAQTTQHARQPREHAGQRLAQEPERLAPVLAPAAGQRPERRAGAIGGRPRDVLARQPLELPAEEPPRPLRPLPLGGVDPAGDRIVVERPRQDGGERLDVVVADRADLHPPGLYG